MGDKRVWHVERKWSLRIHEYAVISETAKTYKVKGGEGAFRNQLSKDDPEVFTSYADALAATASWQADRIAAIRESLAREEHRLEEWLKLLSEARP